MAFSLGTLLFSLVNERAVIANLFLNQIHDNKGCFRIVCCFWHIEETEGIFFTNLYERRVENMKMSSIPSQSILLYIWGFIWLLSNLLNIVSGFPEWILNLFLLVGVVLTILIIRNKIGYVPADQRPIFIGIS